MNLHPDAEVLAFLLGTWRGEGTVTYPTMGEPFGYRDELEFWHVGKPFLAYRQRSWSLDDGRPTHSEAGYWRTTPDGLIELVAAHPTGHVEIAEGRVAGQVVELASRMVGGTATAKEVTAMSRRIAIHDGALSYSLAMAAAGQPLLPHLSSELRRVEE